MESLDLSLETHDFSATAEAGNGAMLTCLVGTADSSVKAALDDFLSQLHAQAMSRSVAELRVDLRKLEFMNSACLRTFATLILGARELPAGSRYNIVLVSDPGVLWQRRSLCALSSLAPEMVTVKAEGA
jgi:hypothetical protein